MTALPVIVTVTHHTADDTFDCDVTCSKPATITRASYDRWTIEFEWGEQIYVQLIAGGSGFTFSYPNGNTHNYDVQDEWVSD